MVKIRLARKGYKKKPFYHIVVADSRSPRDGKYIENIGFFNPVATGNAEKLKIDLEKYQSWLLKGAVPTDRISSIVKQVSKAS